MALSFPRIIANDIISNYKNTQQSDQSQNIKQITKTIHVCIYYNLIQQTRMPFSAPKVKALGIVLQNKYGVKLYSKYYTKNSATDFSKSEFDIKTETGKQKLQKSLTQKVKKMNVISSMDPDKTEIFSLAGVCVLLKVFNQLLVFVLCEEQQNFVLMQSVISCIGKVLPMITSQQYVQKTIEDNLDSIIISIDQILDEGIILCLDENEVFDRLKMREGAERTATSASSSSKKVQQQQQSSSAFNSLFGFAKNTLQKTLNLG